MQWPDYRRADQPRVSSVERRRQLRRRRVREEGDQEPVGARRAPGGVAPESRGPAPEMHEEQQAVQAAGVELRGLRRDVGGVQPWVPMDRSRSGRPGSHALGADERQQGGRQGDELHR